MIKQKKSNTQRGVALVMVLGMVAIIAAWATTAAYEDMIALNRARNQQDGLRATMANESALALTQLYLREDAKLNQTDNLEEDWAMPLPPFPIDDGLIAVNLEDANRFYNLNDLVNDAGELQQQSYNQLKALFTLLDINPNLLDALADWMDSNDIPFGAAGAEDAAYFNQDYHVKNARLDSLGELRLIQGFDRDIIQLLKPHVCVRQANNNGRTLINPNTASIEVLMALFPRMSKEDADALVLARPYERITDITTTPWVNAGDLSRLSVASDAFMVRTDAVFGKANIREDFLLSRTGQTVQLLRRERADWQL